MGSGSAQSGRLIFGALAVGAVIVGTRFLSNSGDEVMYPDRPPTDQQAWCWRGTIDVSVDRYAYEEENCDNNPQQWRGIAMVQLREELEESTRLEMVGGTMVSEVVGLEADLRYDRFRWSIQQSAYTRRCWPEGERRFKSTTRVEVDRFDELGSEEFAVDERGRLEGDVAGTIYYQVPEDIAEIPDYGRTGQYRLNLLPSACGSGRKWITPGRTQHDQIEVPVSCLFGSNFAGSVGIGFKGTACQDEPRFLPNPAEKMKGYFECQISDIEQRSPSPRAETGLISVNWSLKKDGCKDGFPMEERF